MTAVPSNADTQQAGFKLFANPPPMSPFVCVRIGLKASVALSAVLSSSIQRDELTRLDGGSDVKVFGERDYSMRIWVDPEQLAARSLTAGDVASVKGVIDREAALSSMASALSAEVSRWSAAGRNFVGSYSEPTRRRNSRYRTPRHG